MLVCQKWYTNYVMPEEEVVIKRKPFETRIHEIDFFRGILICLVVMDHIFNFTMNFTSGWAGADHLQPYWAINQAMHFYWDHPVRMVVRWLCLISFCFISGISCAFSKSNSKRAMQMVGIWALLFIITNLIKGALVASGANVGVSAFRIDFNVIGVLGWSTLLYCFFEQKNWKWLLVVGLIGLALHPLCQVLSTTTFGKNTYVPFLWRPYVGDDVVGSASLVQGDHMPLFPYLGFFFLGAMVSKLTYAKDKKSYFKRYNWERPICFVGRHTLLIYGTHVLIIFGILSLVGLFIK